MARSRGDQGDGAAIYGEDINKMADSIFPSALSDLNDSDTNSVNGSVKSGTAKITGNMMNSQDGPGPTSK